jgi:hypothetical protein
LNETCRTLYILLLDRASLSQKNNWINKDGHVYIYFPIKELAERMGKGETTVKDSLRILEAKDYIRREKQGFQKASKIYVMLPDNCQEAGKPSYRQPEFRPMESREIGCAMDRYPAASKTNTNNTDRVRTSERYGMYYERKGESL